MIIIKFEQMYLILLNADIMNETVSDWNTMDCTVI